MAAIRNVARVAGGKWERSVGRFARVQMSCRSLASSGNSRTTFYVFNKVQSRLLAFSGNDSVPTKCRKAAACRPRVLLKKKSGSFSQLKSLFHLSSQIILLSNLTNCFLYRNKILCLLFNIFLYIIILKCISRFDLPALFLLIGKMPKTIKGLCRLSSAAISDKKHCVLIGLEMKWASKECVQQ